MLYGLRYLGAFVVSLICAIVAALVGVIIAMPVLIYEAAKRSISGPPMEVMSASAARRTGDRRRACCSRYRAEANP